MGIKEDVRDFIEKDIQNNFIIEPEKRSGEVLERLSDIINTYKPEVIIKAGIGRGLILKEISSNYDAFTVVVEPSFKAIKDYIAENPDTGVKFINGDFHDFPIDYYAAGLIICVDYLDFFDSARAIDEFKRALRFDGIFFIATVVLNDSDVEGIYDDFTRTIFPLHNDYYIAGDLKTFLELKEFSMVKSMRLKFKNNLLSLADYFSKIFKSVERDDAVRFIDEHKTDFMDTAEMDEDYNFVESYYTGVFMRLKPKAERLEK